MARYKRTITVRVDDNLLDLLNTFAESTPGVSAAEWVRRWIEEGVEQYGGATPAAALVQAAHIEREARMIERVNEALETATTLWLRGKKDKYLDQITMLREVVPYIVLDPEVQKALDAREIADDSTAE